jgi:hypothetical protein
MGRLEVQIRHGHDGPSGPVIALAVVIVLAVAGGAARHVASDIGHVVLTVLEVIAWVAGTLAAAALAAGIVFAAVRIRTAHARRPRAIRVESVRLSDAATVRPVGDDPDAIRPALDPARRRPGWPLPGRWAELPLDDRGGNSGRYS